MPAPPAPISASAVISRLRAAGCVYAEDEARLLMEAARSPAHLDAMVSRRAAGEPVEHVIGWAAFRGLRIAVDPGVFVPRRRSEFLVGAAITLIRQAGDERGHNAVIVDLCCGSGALGAALAAALGPVELHAVDIDPAAVRCARRNLSAARGHVYAGDLYQPLPGSLAGRATLLIASPPYVPAGELRLLPAEARLHEPAAALDGGADGLDVARRVVAGAPRWLAPGGFLLVETSEEQGGRLAGFARSAGLTSRVAAAGDSPATVVVCGLPPLAPPSCVAPALPPA